MWYQSDGCSCFGLPSWTNYELLQVRPRLPMGFRYSNDSRRPHRPSFRKKIFPLGNCRNRCCLSLFWNFYDLFHSWVHGHNYWPYYLHCGLSWSWTASWILCNENCLGRRRFNWTSWWFLPRFNHIWNYINHHQMVGTVGDDFLLNRLRRSRWLPFIQILETGSTDLHVSDWLLCLLKGCWLLPWWLPWHRRTHGKSKQRHSTNDEQLGLDLLLAIFSRLYWRALLLDQKQRWTRNAQERRSIQSKWRQLQQGC